MEKEEIFSPSSEKRYTCEVCGVHDIHENDLEKHLKGRKHKFTVRTIKQKVADKCIPQYECALCDTKFTDKEFYQIHFSTRKHRRNLKKDNTTLLNDISGSLQNENLTRCKLRALPIAGCIVGQIDDGLKNGNQKLSSDFIREKFKTKTDKTDTGKHYKSFINSLTAFLAVRLTLDDDIRDFKISVNNRDWKSFGDIVIEVFQKENNEIYVIQCKQISNISKDIDSLDKGKFNIVKQIASLTKTKTKYDLEDLNITKFIIFTTASISKTLSKDVTLKPEALKEWKEDSCVDDAKTENVLRMKPLSRKKKCLVNTTDDNDNIYVFNLDSTSTFCLPKIYLCTNQRKVKHYGRMIDGLLFERFDKCPEFHKDFVQYIENWGNGILGGNFKLRRTDIVLKIGEFLLSPYTVPPEVTSSPNTENYHWWNKVVDTVDVTVIAKEQGEPNMISKICKPLNQTIENNLQKIDPIGKSIDGKNIVVMDISDPKIKAYLFENTLSKIDDDIPLELIYNVFWKAGYIPLLLSAESRPTETFIFNVIKFIRNDYATRLTRKFVMFVSSPINKTNLAKNAKTLRCFTRLNDLKDYDFDLFAGILKEMKIRVSYVYSLSLDTIYSTDKFFLNYVSPSMFLDMSLCKYSFKAACSGNVKTLDDLKLILSDEVMTELKKHVNTAATLPETDIKGRQYHQNGYGRWLRDINPRLFKDC